MNIKEARYITSSALRSLCIRQNWYTWGTNEEYSHLFELADKDDLTTADLVEIARDIIAHSEPDENLAVPYVCFELADIAVNVFEDFDEEE